MNRKKYLLTGFYLINLITVLVLIAFVITNPFVNILLSIYIILFSGIYIYATRKK